MSQICPSPSRQLAEAALAFRRARRKFPKNLGVYECSGDAARNCLKVYPAIFKDSVPGVSNVLTDPSPHYNPKTDGSFCSNPQRRRNYPSYPSLPSSRTAFWSDEHHRDQRAQIIEGPNGTARPEVVCATKIQGSSEICHLHGYPATRRRPSIPRKPQTVKYYNRKASTVGNRRPKEEPKKVYCGDSPTVDDFPTKLQTWENRTQQGCYRRKDNTVSRRGMIFSGQNVDFQKTCPKDQTSKLSRNGRASCKPHSSIAKKPQDLNSNANVCVRPSLMKAAQQKVDLDIKGGGKSYEKYGIGGKLSKISDMKSTWDENLNVINHKDSMSILMERFKGNDKHHSLKLQNIYELNSVLGSKTSCGEGEGELLQYFEDAESIETHLLPRKSSSSVSPVAKLGKVANQALREGENRFKNLKSRLNKSGICSSPKGTPWRRVF